MLEGIKNRDGANRNVVLKKRVVPLQLVIPKTKQMEDCTGGAGHFVTFAAPSEGGDRAGDLLFQIAQQMSMGEVLPYSTLTSKCSWGVGTTQNDKVKTALPQVGVWRLAKTGFGATEEIKAIRRVASKDIGFVGEKNPGNAKEVIECATRDHPTAYGPPAAIGSMAELEAAVAAVAAAHGKNGPPAAPAPAPAERTLPADAVLHAPKKRGRPPKVVPLPGDVYKQPLGHVFPPSVFEAQVNGTAMPLPESEKKPDDDPTPDGTPPKRKPVRPKKVVTRATPAPAPVSTEAASAAYEPKFKFIGLKTPRG